MWDVRLTKKCFKQLAKLPEKVQDRFYLLHEELKVSPYMNNWKNYGQLEKNKFHCHIRKGKPTYVACWEIKNKEIRITEVYYVGTHENAPY